MDIGGTSHSKKDYVNFLVNKPCLFGHMVGFTKLTDIHNEWIKDMVAGEKDKTLQAHRG